MRQNLKSILFNLDDILAGVSLSLIVVVTVLGVFMRYALGAPLVWTEEVSLALVVWFVFLGASSAMKRHAHISIDFFVSLLPKRLKKYSEILIAIINFIVLIIITILGIQLAMQAGMKITPVLKISYTIIDIAVPLGAIMMIISLTVRLINDIKNGFSQEKE